MVDFKHENVLLLLEQTLKDFFSNTMKHFATFRDIQVIHFIQVVVIEFMKKWVSGPELLNDPSFHPVDPIKNRKDECLNYVLSGSLLIRALVGELDEKIRAEPKGKSGNSGSPACRPTKWEIKQSHEPGITGSDEHSLAESHTEKSFVSDSCHPNPAQQTCDRHWVTGCS